MLVAPSHPAFSGLCSAESRLAGTASLGRVATCAVATAGSAVAVVVFCATAVVGAGGWRRRRSSRIRTLSDTGARAVVGRVIPTLVTGAGAA